MGRAFEYRRASKEKRWDKMSKLFPKLGKAISIAVKEGGSGDPDMNSKLRTAIMAAKAQNMPKDNIEAAIKRALGKDGIQITEVNYEIKAPHGALFFVECATDNTTRTVANLKSYVNKFGGQMLTNNSLEFMFSRKAHFEVAKEGLGNLEELELELIDYGLESMEIEDEIVHIYGDYTSFGSLANALEKMNADVKKAALERIANNPVEFSEEQLVDIEKLLDRIEDDDDVQAVFTNIA
ncbi:YebC/PmpR family DNA-binding transcriptional regulator [Helicobacter pullorum]|uniref:Probable transcriptional regulatory protein HPU229334_05130 n=1 Tax=Helicobacter pullorum TaxID=35818 RepID=A0A0N0LTG1_9HELI|nr:YebC/PmpR family DNA-binding transcriptional regulator [Helicobacter pullorum]HIS08756.1 YebC/PmpR family DNA-binding transcriptional regulator [Candidatus Scatomorpha intestinipullorum]KAB0574210.1 YebC/PmpR family DNA-binding transcriptional regulator [Helicobacter pullorum NCTC 12824]KPH53322.1 transcriptional regulator [Helicobacter pullorum]KPH53547.1 transcriptional regulator [Helicobacter pullorum]KPH55918.1 transcriptional regulator [Helicobacter pullorum]